MDQVIIKVCGNADIESLKELLTFPQSAHPQMLGFIIFKESKRYVTPKQYRELAALLPSHIEKVLVCVNESQSLIQEYYDLSPFSYIQLHGNEDANYITALKNAMPHIRVIKAISIQDEKDFDFEINEKVHFYLLDTKTSEHGGSGLKFDWSLLAQYKGDVPFLLAGGIELSDAEMLKRVFREYDRCNGFDINSRFEIRPGVKNIEKVISFISEVREN